MLSGVSFNTPEMKVCSSTPVEILMLSMVTKEKTNDSVDQRKASDRWSFWCQVVLIDWKNLGTSNGKIGAFENSARLDRVCGEFCKSTLVLSWAWRWIESFCIMCCLRAMQFSELFKGKKLVSSISWMLFAKFTSEFVYANAY